MEKYIIPKKDLVSLLILEIQQHLRIEGIKEEKFLKEMNGRRISEEGVYYKTLYEYVLSVVESRYKKYKE